MKTAILLLVLLPSCAMVGHGTQRSVEAGGVAATSVVATPVVGFLSWPLWNWLGGYAGTALSGTEEIRVAARNEPRKPSGATPELPRQELSLWDTGGLGSITRGNAMLYLLLAIAFFALGGPAWALKKIRDAKTADDAWVAALDKDRAEHAKATAALTAKVEMLERMVLTSKPPQP